MRPPLTHQDTHGAFDDVKDVVFRVRVSARTLRVRLKPPFRDGIARFTFEFVGLKDGSDAAHWIGTTLTGAENHSFARGAGRFIHASICWRGAAYPASNEIKLPASSYFVKVAALSPECFR